jgi:hypothetical protein
MRRILPILLLAFFGIESAKGRIGETEGQIEARYGQAINVMPSQPGAGLTKCYPSNSFLVSVTFLNGRSVREMIVKNDKSKMGDAEIQSFLESKSDDSPEHRMTGPITIMAGVQQWRSVDQPARVAFYDSQTRALFITTQKFIDLTNGMKRQSIVRNGVSLGATERPRGGFKDFSKSNAVTMRRGQAQPSSSPATK